MYFNEHIGMTNDPDTQRAAIVIEDHHKNPTGNINGGVFLAMADNLSTGIANYHYREKFNEDVFMVGVDLHATMLSNQQGGTIYASGEPVRVGRRITVIRTRVTGDNGKVLAEVTTTHVPVAPAS